MACAAATGNALGSPAASTATPTAANGPQRSLKRYVVPPNLNVQRADGANLSLPQALWDGRPVVMSFMYSSCTTICPITNQTLVEFTHLLGKDAERINVVSVSIDPDHDSVRKLSDYARRTGAKGHFFTSDPATSEAVQRAFDVWRGDKMNHTPVFLMSKGPGSAWLRLDGLLTPRELLAEYRGLTQHR